MVKKRYGIDKKPGKNKRPQKQENKSNAVLQKAGISSRKKRERYSKTNSAATERYNKTYELLDDETLKANFKSQNKNVVSAMLIAVDKLADQGLYFDASTPKANKSITKLLQQYYDETLESIESGDKAGSYDPEKITQVDKKRRQKNAEPKKKKPVSIIMKIRQRLHVMEKPMRRWKIKNSERILNRTINRL